MPELKFFPETHVAFVSEIAPYKKSISRGFKRLFDWLETNGIQPTGPMLAILYDDPSKVAPENQRSDLCAPIGPHVDGSGDVRTKEIGGLKVATISYEGEKNASRAFEEVYDWLREQGYSPTDVPVVKYLSQINEKVRAEIGVPVVKRELKPGAKKLKASAAKRATTRRSATRKNAAKKTARRTAK
jgi:DNA gyrase inhibitor GyrI